MQERYALLPWGTATPYSLPNAPCSFGQCTLLVILSGIILGVLAYFVEPLIVLYVLAVPVANLSLLLLLMLCMRNRLQIWLLKHPKNLLSRLWIPLISVVEGAMACDPSYLPGLRDKLGKNFCCAGQVILSDWPVVEATLTSGQARVTSLGTQPMIASRLPGLDGGPRNIFLLALDDIEPDNAHHAFRRCMVDTLFTAGARARQVDATAKALLDELARDYQELVLSAKSTCACCAKSTATFFSSNDHGFVDFWVKYSHYVLLGLDPHDKQVQNILHKLFFHDMAVLNYLLPFGFLPGFNHTSAIKEISRLYMESPAMQGFVEGCPVYHNMAKEELAKLTVAIFRIAAVTGVTHLGKTMLGWSKLPKYRGGHRTDEIDVLRVLDELPLEDPEAVRRYILECIRLNPPVTSACRVATEALTVNMSGVMHTFPPGTKVLIPQGMAMVDTEVWGPTAYAFDLNRPQFVTHFTGFNAVGDRSAGRACPGQQLVLEAMTVVLQRIGAERRNFAAQRCRK